MAAYIEQAGDLAMQLRQSLAYSERVQVALGCAFLGGAYLRLVVKGYAPSYGSLLAILPLIALNVWLPLLFDAREEICSRLIFLLLLMWLANFKAIGLCFNRGPLVGSWTVAQTILLYVMPIYPSTGAGDGGVKKGRLTDSQGSTSQAVMSFLANTTFLVALAYTLATVTLPLIIKYYLYGLALYGFITFMMDGPAALLIALLDMQVCPPFDKPWLSTSLADFWGRRWNNTVSLTLRALVYDPLVEGRLMAAAAPAAAAKGPAAAAAAVMAAAAPARTPMWLRLAGACSTFAVSGIMHEFILYFLAPEGQYYPGWWFAFFFVQAPLLIGEGLILKQLKASKFTVNRFAGIAYVHFFVLLTAWLFWYPPVDRFTKIADEITDGVNRNVAALTVAAQSLAEQYGLEPAAVAGSLFSAATVV